MSKKLLIMENAIELFAENGFESTSVQQITERCGISKGSFYLYFKSKDELITSLIDFFMGHIISDIEQMVITEKNSNQLLYKFLYISLSEFQKHAHFAKIFIKDQSFSFNKELLDRMETYMITFNKIILSIIDRQFPKMDPNMHLDTLFTINGLMKSYSELFLIDHYRVDVNLLCNVIVEKVSIIAEHSSTPFVKPEYLKRINVPMSFSKDDIIKKIDEAISEIGEDQLIHESLVLLKEHLLNPTLQPALIQGLLHNIRTNQHCSWIAYVYSLYINGTETATS